MIKKLIFILFTLITLFIVSCTPKHSEIVVAQYGDHDITMKDFENAYAKNVGSIEQAKKDSIDDYNKFLDLFVNFKMKLRNAYVRDLKNDPEIIKEINTYRKSIGVKYFLDKELVDKGIKTLYERRKHELRISHLLIKSDKISDKEAKAKAQAILDSIKNGASFEDEVLKYSDDSYTKEKGGDIYYVTAGTVLPELEDLVYSTPAGEVCPTLLHTRFGYHIIKVTERRKRIPQIKASHILFMIGKNASDSLKNAKYEKAKEILAKIKNGEDFAKLAKEYSEDPGSKDRGGDLGYFARRQMVQPFDEVAFNLKVGQVSDIVKTRYGYHIIKLIEKRPYPSFKSDEKSLKDIYEKTRRKIDYDKLVDSLAIKYNYQINDMNVKRVASNSDSTKINDGYLNSNLHKNFGKKVLFTIANEPFDLDTLVSYTMADPKSNNLIIDGTSLGNFMNKFKENKVLELEANAVLKNDSTFQSLMQDYKNGILIFKLQEDEVWNKMKIDSTAIHKLYEERKNNYIIPDKVQFKELYSKSDSVINEYMTELKNGINFDSLLVKSGSKGRAKYVEYKNGLKEVGNIELAKAAFQLKNIGDYSVVINDGNGYSIVQLVNKEPSRLKTFDEARAEVTSAYQDIESAQLENEYVARLKKLYNPKLYYDELQNAFKD